jgi:tetratricopeptide (TPR) repeat protein
LLARLRPIPEASIRYSPNLLAWLGRNRLLVLASSVLTALALSVAGALIWAQYHFRAAEQALRRQSLEEAERHLEQCLKVPFRGAEVHLLAAQVARRLDAYQEASRHLAICARQRGMTEAVALERVLLTAQQGDFDNLEGLLKAHAGPQDAEAELVLEAAAKGYWNRFSPADALKCLNALLERQPRHVQGLLLRASVWQKLADSGQPEHEQEALQDYAQAVEIAPSFECSLGLAGALYRLGYPWKAALEYERLQSLRPSDGRVLLGLALCRFNLHQVDEARRLLDELLEQHPGSVEALVERGRLALHAVELPMAEQCLRQAAALSSPSDSGPGRLLGECLQLEDRSKEAGECLGTVRQAEANVLLANRLIREANRHPDNLELRCQIANKLMALGREQEGLCGLFFVLEQQPRYPPAHAALADYFDRIGQTDRAERHRRASLH